MKFNDIFIYVDESGSYNDKALGNFQVSLLFVEKHKNKKFLKVENKFIKKCKKFIKNNQEIKSHTLLKKGYINLLIEYFQTSIISKHKYVISYIENINKKTFSTTGELYNWLIRASLERALDQNIINKQQKIHIILDNFKNSTKYQWDLQDYLKNILKLQIKTLAFKDSKTTPGLLSADITSFLANRFIQSICKCKKTIYCKCSEISLNRIFIRKCYLNKIKK